MPTAPLTSEIPRSAAYRSCGERSRRDGKGPLEGCAPKHSGASRGPAIKVRVVEVGDHRGDYEVCPLSTILTAARRSGAERVTSGSSLWTRTAGMPTASAPCTSARTLSPIIHTVFG